ncbi:MAG: ribosomal RNA small subunit methyltransferase A [Candidatus Omnitrophica bacterium]|nr:ribosomal RNA small subunit methyltransferase A [Candidatus Omnitrophota bacterium]
MREEIALIKKAKTILAQIGAAPRRKLGQNFMVSEQALSSIVEALSLDGQDTVLEIGAGLGFLTRRLLQKTERVIAVEKDPLFAHYLREAFKTAPLKIVEKDVLDCRLERDFAVKGKVKVVGNIPYGITSPILGWLVGERRRVSESALTVQWEVARRLWAKPGTKDWGALSVFAQFYSEVSLVKKIGRGNFFPAANVDSAVVRLVFPEKPLYRVRDEEKLFGIVRRAFQKRRKTLFNALKDRTGAADRPLLPIFAELRIDPKRRPETLSIEEWAALSESGGGHFCVDGMRFVGDDGGRYA